jgi:hypothetical protein
MRKLIFIAVLACFIQACGSGSGEDKADTPDTTKDQTTTTTTANTLPGYPKEKVLNLVDSCDYIDIIFYYHEFSINQSNPKDIRGMLNYVSTVSPETLNAGCQPIGRIFFQIDGRNAAEADIFFQQECLYFLFYEDGKYAYANNLTQSGVNFFSNIFAQVKVQQNAIQQKSQQGQ